MAKQVKIVKNVMFFADFLVLGCTAHISLQNHITLKAQNNFSSSLQIYLLFPSETQTK